MLEAWIFSCQKLFVDDLDDQHQVLLCDFVEKNMVCFADVNTSHFWDIFPEGTKQLHGNLLAIPNKNQTRLVKSDSSR